MTDAVYDSLFAVASSHPNFDGRKSEESDQDFLHRICDVIGSVPDDQWTKLSEGAKQWYDLALDDDNRLKVELTIPDGFPAAVAAAPPTEPTPAARRRPAKVAEPAKATKVVVYDEVLRVIADHNANFVPKRARETDQVYFGRLLSSLPESIPVSIQEWLTAADQAVDQGRSIPVPDGYPEVKVETPEVCGMTRPETTAAVPKTNGAAHPSEEQTNYVDEVSGKPLTGIELYNRKLAAGEVPPRRKRSTKAEMLERENTTPKRRNRRPQVNSTTAIIRVALTNNPKMTVDELQSLIKAGGKEAAVTTIASTRAAHLASLQTLQSLGWSPPATATE